MAKKVPARTDCIQNSDCDDSVKFSWLPAFPGEGVEYCWTSLREFPGKCLSVSQIFLKNSLKYGKINYLFEKHP